MATTSIETMIKGFENGTYPKEKWTHFAHFQMALWYVYHNTIEAARTKIKNGIRSYNQAVGGKNTDTEGYHETITEFYILMVSNYVRNNTGKSFNQLLVGLGGQPFVEKEYPFQFYSKEVLLGKEARLGWIEPDLKKFTADTRRGPCQRYED